MLDAVNLWRKAQAFLPVLRHSHPTITSLRIIVNTTANLMDVWQYATLQSQWTFQLPLSSRRLINAGHKQHRTNAFKCWDRVGHELLFSSNKTWLSSKLYHQNLSRKDCQMRKVSPVSQSWSYPNLIHTNIYSTRTTDNLWRHQEPHYQTHWHPQLDNHSESKVPSQFQT